MEKFFSNPVPTERRERVLSEEQAEDVHEKLSKPEPLR